MYDVLTTLIMLYICLYYYVIQEMWIIAWFIKFPVNVQNA